MINNNLIQEEINRAKHLWGYDTSKTIFEQATGNTGTSNTCYGITQLAPCSGGTSYVGYANWCFSVNGAAGTQGDNGTVVTSNDGMTGTIQSTAPISNPTNNYILPFTQTTCPTTGNTSSCLAISQRTMCTGNTINGGYLATLCGSIDGQPLTQNDVGRVVRAPGNISTDNLQFTIDQVQGLNQTQPSMGFVSDSCPNTNTGTTTTGGGLYPNGTPCYACINNQIESVLFPSSALGQPYPACAPTAYGYQGTANELPGGTSSYNYPSIWSEVSPTNCGTVTGTTNANSFPTNYDPATWWNTFTSNMISKSWYATKKCNFFQSRIDKWNGKLQSGVGPAHQNMLNNKIQQLQQLQTQLCS